LSRLHEELYTSLNDAKVEIQARWHNTALKKEIEGYLGNVPDPFRSDPRAVLDRTIATPDIEFFHFKEMAKQVGLKPLVIEYVKDKFCTKNPDKLRLAKMVFFYKRNRKMEAIVKNHTILDCAHDDGKECTSIQTLWNENFVDFHHRIFDASNSTGVKIFDASSWFKSNGKSAKQYYRHFLALFICNGILFENFLMDEREGRFTTEVVIPAFKKVKEYFGVKPLIVPVIPENEINDKYWWCYPEWVEQEVERCLSHTTKKP